MAHYKCIKVYERRKSIRSQLAQDVELAGALSGGIVLFFLFKDGKLVANNNDDDRNLGSQ